MRLDLEGLKTYLPHRSFNLIPDEVVIADDRRSATSRTRIPTGDARGRMVFGRKDAAGRPCWYEPFLIELMALTGVPIVNHELAPLGQVAVFSMVSRVSFTGLAPLHEEVLGFAQLARQRSGFSTYTTWAECGGQRILEAEVMSGAAVLGEIASFPARPFHGQLPRTPVDVSRFAWKPSHLRFIDDLVHVEAGERKLAAAFTYPANHAFVPGHFPDAPLMMGVTQWAAIADAAWAAAGRFGIDGGVVASGVIKRQDGTEVMDVRELVLEVDGGLPRIASTKRIAFREPVRPTDGLVIEVTVAPTVL